jgi:hypothetical protein
MAALEAFTKFKNDNGTYDIDEASLTNILSTFIKLPKEKAKRPPSTYMSWLNDNRDAIKETYFGDYDDVETWDDETIKQYFKDKDLGEPKKMKKPNMCILISVKAGKLWKELDDDEKAKYKAKPKDEAPKVEAPKDEAPKVEAPKVEAPKVEAPIETKSEPKKKRLSKPKKETPKVEEPKVEEPKVEAPKVEEPKVEEPKVEAPKDEAPKVEEPKKKQLSKPKKLVTKPKEALSNADKNVVKKKGGKK